MITASPKRGIIYHIRSKFRKRNSPPIQTWQKLVVNNSREEEEEGEESKQEETDDDSTGREADDKGWRQNDNDYDYCYNDNGGGDALGQVDSDNNALNRQFEAVDSGFGEVGFLT
jgi:hypothetical protein